jgi:hypothetical protein
MNDYILVIHGTWNPPKDDLLKDGPPEIGTAGDTPATSLEKKWFQLDRDDPQNFCYRLNQALAFGPLHDAVWRQCRGKEIAFKWSGDNTHEAREEGAQKLCALLFDLRKSDPEARIHIIAHSHGGNVALRAIELYSCRLLEQARDIVVHIHRKHFSHGWLSRLIKRKAQNTDNAVAIEEALREVCGDELANSKDLQQLTGELLLPLLQKVPRTLPVFLRDDQQLKDIDLRVAAYEGGFHAAWTRSPQSHRLGRFVFMGTPFYYKRWSISFGARLFRYMASAILLILVIILLGTSFFPVPSHDWSVGVLAVALALFYFISSPPEYSNVNVYYTEPLRLPESQKAPPLDALVLSAGLLDEALAALSVRPLVYGFVTPLLKKRLSPPFLANARPFRSGENDNSVSRTRRLAWLLIQYISAPIVAAFMTGSRWFVQPRATKQILDLVSAAGFGLPVREFSDAVITPKKELIIPGVFQADDVVDVTELFARTRLMKPSPSTPAEFDFLWNQTKLDERLEESFTWKKEGETLS